MRVLVTGATGYLGSHTIVALMEAGHEVIGVDDFSNSSPLVLTALEQVTGKPITFVELDVCNQPLLDTTLERYRVDAAIHFAGRKYVAESVEDPLRYYHCNVGASASLFSSLQRQGVEKVVFSSSCTVYGDPEEVPVLESSALAPISPYGRSKALVEEMLEEFCRVSPGSAIALRYFNPIGAHPSGLLGDVPQGTPNNLVPYIMQVATCQRTHLEVFGDDYPTDDGTCVRDYVHVMDLAEAHVKALDHLEDASGYTALNVGTGTGQSVLEVIDACRAASGRPIPYTVVDRRPGDAAAVFAEPTRAEDLIGWTAKRSLDEMCLDHWRFVEGSLGLSSVPERAPVRHDPPVLNRAS